MQGSHKQCCNAACSENNAYCSTVKTYCSKYCSTCYTGMLTFNNPRGVHFVTLSLWCSVWRRLNGWCQYRGCPQHVFRNKSTFISNVLGNSALCQLVGVSFDTTYSVVIFMRSSHVMTLSIHLCLQHTDCHCLFRDICFTDLLLIVVWHRINLTKFWNNMEHCAVPLR